ncbi:acyl-CoA thioesterase/bile acid-CoA:amino acid N-acyltransferase family protein [Deinococcus sp.]|uniref:acyl-CoA thioesterase/bile acid-CoA:amino acid N-acyltransferase family protein n=1 Tax=Deinococcus sp. TaxID=47478 RepID=UPI0025D4617B|nr:acyl-CoA thioesterase/bile acid-CoA:amino acid N-acyltransferase family protein [Deinococcus sp.]
MHIELPAAELISKPFSLVVSGLPPDVETILHTETQDGSGETWSAQATFLSSPEGHIDVAQMAPLAGSYSGADVQGLIWSMRPRADLRPVWFELPSGGFAVTVQATQNGQLLAEASTLRRARSPGLREEVVQEQGLFGTLFSPPPGTPLRGAVLSLGGSEGGLHSVGAALAALLASQGFVVLQLAYFGAPGLPEALINIPLEYFRSGLAYLRERPEVGGKRVGVTGVSKGAEVALLLGATYPDEIGAVVAVASSGMVFEGIDREGTHPAGVPMSSWSLDGQPLPYLPYPPGWTAMFAGPPPFLLTPVHRRTMQGASQGTLAAATIPTERIQGPVLLVTGGEDQVWNAYELSLVAQRRREEAKLPVRHLSHPQAGHFLSLPGLPTDRFPEAGGEAWADAQLQLRAWALQLKTLASVWEADTASG